jgi:hypothetical protein
MPFENSKQNLSEHDFISLANTIGCDIPTPFIEHYKSNNGGYPEENYVLGIDHEFTFQGFFPIKYGNQTIESIHSDVLDWGVVDKFIPFGFDDGGNIFYISLTPCTQGNVFLLTTDTHDIFKVCADFETFLNSLKFRDE